MSKLYIFDVDGVLEVEDQITKRRADALISAISKKKKISFEKAKKEFSKSSDKLPDDKKKTSLYKLMSFGFSRKNYEEILDSIDPEGIISEHDGAKEVLNKLSKENIIVTYSNAPRKSTERTLEILKLTPYITKAYSTNDFSESKPSENNLRKIISEQKFDVSKTIVIGNSYEKDIKPAMKIGIKTILFDPEGKYPNKESIRKLKDIC